MGMDFFKIFRRAAKAPPEPTLQERFPEHFVAYALEDALAWESERVTHQSFVIHVEGDSHMMDFISTILAHAHPEISFASSIARERSWIMSRGARHDGPSKIAPFDLYSPLALVPSDGSLERCSKGFDVLFWMDKPTSQIDATLEIRERDLRISFKGQNEIQVYPFDDILKMRLYSSSSYGEPSGFYEGKYDTTKWLSEALQLSKLQDTRPLPYHRAIKRLETLQPSSLCLTPTPLETQILRTARWWFGETDPTPLLEFLRKELPSEESQEIFYYLIKDSSSYHLNLSYLRVAQNLV